MKLAFQLLDYFPQIDTTVGTAHHRMAVTSDLLFAAKLVEETSSLLPPVVIVHIDAEVVPMLLSGKVVWLEATSLPVTDTVQLNESIARVFHLGVSYSTLAHLRY